HVEEAGQLAGAEALLDLLLEAPDEEHLAEEIAQQLVRDGAFLLDPGHGGKCTRLGTHADPVSSGPCAWPSSGRSSSGACPTAGRRRGSCSSSSTGTRTAPPRCSGPRTRAAAG